MTNSPKLKLALVLMLCAPLLHAQSFSGRITSAFYGYERSPGVDGADVFARGYQGIQFDLRGKNLLLRTYAQIDGDFNTPLAGDANVRLFNFYLHARNLAGRADLRLGRQPVFGGVGAGTIDGAQLSVRATKWLRLKAFGGGLLPADQGVEIIDDFGDNYLAGGQIILSPGHRSTINAGYYRKLQSLPGYNTLRADSVGTVFTQFIQPASQAYEFATLDAMLEMGSRSMLYGRADYDLVGGTLSRAEGSLDLELSPRLGMTGAYTFRSARLPWNSIFAVFNSEDNHEIEGGLRLRTGAGLRLYATAAGIFYNDDESLRMSLGFDGSHGGLNYVHRSGYAGELDGINGSLFHSMAGGRLLPTLQLSWASYRQSGDPAGRQSLFAGAAGVQLRPRQPFTIDSQLQILHNRYYSTDVRLLARIQYRFFIRRTQ